MTIISSDTVSGDITIVIARSGQHGDDISGLYQVDDSTGVMAKHKEKLQAAFLDHQVDMKIMYYELIKMLMEHDKEQQSEEEYHVTKTVQKIEGK